MTRVYIAIGSNLASPLEQVNAAVTALAAIPDSRMVAVSSLPHAAAGAAGSA
jgi:2-amino-4-hydroxy-6-hydroxymethyldihydropteridine diphosphokinase